MWSSLHPPQLSMPPPHDSVFAITYPQHNPLTVSSAEHGLWLPRHMLPVGL